jgi:hypothetical protein
MSPGTGESDQASGPGIGGSGQTTAGFAMVFGGMDGRAVLTVRRSRDLGAEGGRSDGGIGEESAANPVTGMDRRHSRALARRSQGIGECHVDLGSGGHLRIQPSAQT